MSEEQKVGLSEAKGRPMLQWVGKRSLDSVASFPAQLVEKFDPTSKNREGNLLFYGDNKDVLAWLLAHGYRGQVKLIYIDPPFDSGADYVRRVRLRGTDLARIHGEAYSLVEQIQYTDIWANDMYLQFMYERLLLLKELLAEDGAIIVHCDWHQGHRIRLIMDEVFGTDNFRNEIIWHYGQRTAARKKRLDMKHDNLLFYAKTDDMELNEVTVPWDYDDFVQSRHDILVDDEGREYIWTDGGPSGGRYKRYVEEVLADGKPLDSVWDLPLLNSSDSQREGFPTQKPDYLLERIIRACSRPGELILDCFVGSGTTAAVAQELGRRWIVADINKGAVQITSKRLQRLIQQQIVAANEPKQEELDFVEGSAESLPAPAELSFSVYQVNDYDLTIQHNEAVNLAAEHIGIDRLKTDQFFDGTLGKKLVKIISFNHPLSPLDLQNIQDELTARPQEDRDIVVVSLGQELAVDEWLEDYNNHRPINKIEVIELRTDEKYGKFFVHQPAEADVSIERRNGTIHVDIEDFISPTIVERLEMDTPLFKAQIPDWRAMVDVVMIDTSYDGEVFDIDLSDVPERKNDLVAGEYEVLAPAGETTVAVKIIDMLGEEVLFTQDL